MQRLIGRSRIFVSFLVVVVFGLLGSFTYAQQCSDQQCDYTISIVPVLDFTDDSTLPITFRLDRTVVNTCSGTIITTGTAQTSISYMHKYSLSGALLSGGFIESIRVRESTDGIIQPTPIDISLTGCVYDGGLLSPWRTCVNTAITSTLTGLGFGISDFLSAADATSGGVRGVTFRNVNNTSGTRIGIDDQDVAGTYNVDGSTPGQAMSLEIANAQRSIIGIGYDILTFTGIQPPDPNDLWDSLSGVLYGIDMIDHAASNFNVVVESGSYVFPSETPDGTTGANGVRMDNHSETVVESGSVDSCGTCSSDPDYLLDIDEDGLLDLCEDNFIEVFSKTYDISNQKIYYTVQAFIPEGETGAHFDDSLNSGTGIATIDTGSILVSSSDTGINRGNLVWTSNIAGNVESFAIDVEEQNGFTGGTAFTITYEVDVLAQGIVCNVCELNDNVDPGGITRYQDWLTQSAYAQAIYGSTGICVFVPNFDKELIQETDTTVTWRISGNIGTGQSYTVSDMLPAGTLLLVTPDTSTNVTYGSPFQSANAFSYVITNNSTTEQTWSITFVADITGETDPVCNQALLQALGQTYSILLDSDNPDTPLDNYDATCACPVGTEFVNGNCVVPPAYCTDLPPNTIACNTDAPGVTTGYYFDSGCNDLNACTFDCALGFYFTGSTCSSLCTNLPNNAIACAGTLEPLTETSFGTNFTGDCNTTTAPPDYCFFTCPDGTTWDGNDCLLNACNDALLPANASYCNENLLPADDNQTPIPNEDCISTIDACEFDCDEGYEWVYTLYDPQNPENRLGYCEIKNTLIKEATVSSTGVISYEIRGYVAADTASVDIEDYITGGTLVPATVIAGNFNSPDGLTLNSGPTIPGPNTGFIMTIDNPNSPGAGGTFTFTFQGILTTSIGIPVVCNEAILFTGVGLTGAYSDDPDTADEPSVTPELHDPTCVSGYDLKMDKFVQPTWPASTYPDNIAYGEVFDGDWFVYHVEVSNNGPFIASGVIVSDPLPVGVTAFWQENPQAPLSGLTFLPPNGDDPAFPGATSFVWEIQGPMAPGETTGFDLFATLDNGVGGYATGEQICNVATTYVTGDINNVNDSDPSNNFDALTQYDDACLTLTDSCVRTCEGEIYATGFVWTVSANTVIVDATCIVEATCGDSDEFAADPAVIEYGTSSISTTIVGGSFNFDLPSDTVTGATVNIVIDVSACAGAQPCIETATLSGIQASDEYDGTLPDDFQNYNLLLPSFSVVGSDVSFDVQTRTRRHRLSCYKATNSCHDDMYVTYELDPLDWQDASFFANPSNQVLFETPNLDYVRERSTEPLNNQTVGGMCDTCNTTGCNNICEVCPAGSILFITNSGGNLITECQCPDGTPAVDGNLDNIADNCGGGTSDKTAVVSGNLVTYTVDGFIDAGYTVVYISDTLSGNASFTGTVLLNITQGTGSLGPVTWTGNQLDIQVNNEDINQGVIFTLTYEAVITSGSTERTCNQASFGTGITGNPYLVTDNPDTPATGDATCVCEDGYEECGLVCAPTGACTPYFEKTIVGEGTGFIVYQLSGVVPGNYGSFSFIDTLTGADHPATTGEYDVVEVGSGSLEILIDIPNSSSITISGENNQLPVYHFTITYTGTVSSGWDMSIDGPVCNQLSTSGSALCECPGSTILCPDGDVCVTDIDDCTTTFCGDGIVQSPNETGTGGINDDGYEQCDGTGGTLFGGACDANCVCDAGSFFCAFSDACVPDGWPCAPIDKSVNVSQGQSGDVVVHTIVISNPTSGDRTGVELLDILPDTLTGSFAPPYDTATASGNNTIYSWSGITLLAGESQTYIFTGTITCGASGCVVLGDQVCNTAQLLIGGILIDGNYDDEACIDIVDCIDDSECGVDEVCDIGRCVENSFCTSFDVSPNSGDDPLTTTYSCVGTGNGSGMVYSVIATNQSGGAVIATGNTATGTILFVSEGAYDVICTVNGDSGLTCNGQAMNLTQATTIIQGTMDQIVADSATSGAYLEFTTGTCGFGRQTGFVTDTDLATYLDLSAQAFSDQLASDIIAYMASYALSQSCTFGAPSGGQTALVTRLGDSADIVLGAECTETCTDVVGVAHHGSCASSIETCCNGVDDDCDDEVDEGCTCGGGSSCGDGVVNAGEECDDGNNTNGDGCSSSCDDENTNGGDGDSGGDGGVVHVSNNGDEPLCAWVDPPSIQLGEYLPFRWDLELSDMVDADATSCNDLDGGAQIPGSSLLCTFEIYNGSSPQPIMLLSDLPCLKDKWKEDGITAFYDVPGANSTGSTPMGRNYVKITEGNIKNTLGEFQLVLKKIDYALCNGTAVQFETYDGISKDRICTMNFAVSDGYLMNQGSALGTLPNTDLSDYKYLNGDVVVSQTELSQISDTKLSEYKEGKIDYLIDPFVQRYTRLAIQDRSLTYLSTASFKKTVSSNIYVYDGGVDRKPLIVGGGYNDGSTFTVIVNNADLVVDGGLQGNGMYIVPDGHVIFENGNCDLRDTVQGIFITTRGFTTPVIANSNKSADERCNDGGLVVDGMLVGPGVTDVNFVSARRSVLRGRFNVANISQEKKVFDGASVLIKTNPSLWNHLPPGADELSQIMVVYK